jgi:DNA-binding CsgD family transcriptional regulator
VTEATQPIGLVGRPPAIARCAADATCRPALDYDYRVRELASGEIEIEALWSLGEQRVHLRGVCYEVLHGRSSSCELCPLRNTQGTPATRRMVKACIDAESGEYELVSAIRIGADVTHISVRRLDIDTFAAILQARLDELAARAKLSDRERTVLRHLMAGAPLGEIARALDIGMRTVKFHQANLLSKLGADSRSDLLRLLF